LAKASSVVGALVSGGYGGLLGYLVVRLHAGPAHDTEVSAAGLAAGVLLVIAGLLLEHACRVPGPPPDADAQLEDERASADRR
jgi:hypothetical protein